ncbi:MAG: ATP-binding cassette domain-containing protein [Actinobacteria bacterium]|nr:ATP-binding cassette domain-containing protein [Actinomycetota bacterium]
MLVAEGLTKKFNDVLAVDRVGFEADAGEIFGLLGPNGAGKTTTIRLIATVLSPTEGTAWVCGFDIVEESQEVRRNIGVLTTDIGAYDRLTGRENLRYFGELYGIYGDRLEKRVKEIGELLEILDFIDRPAGGYSTGMKQKLAIARSVIHDPSVIIFDEPTSGLDVLASQTVLGFMKKAKEMGKLVVLSTHQMSDAERLCDRAAIIHKGKILTVDTIANLKEATGSAHLEDAFLELVGAEPVKVMR